MTSDPLMTVNSVTFETAAQHACASVPVVTAGDCVADVRQGLVGHQYESASHIIVCDSGKYRGIVRIEVLLSAAGDATMGDLMDREAPVVAPGVDQEVAAWHAVRKGESALPVIDQDARFMGLIPPHRLLSVLLSEHEEDLSRLGGFLKTSMAARVTSEEPVKRRCRHRLPWLLVGLCGALLAAEFVSWFEAQLEHNVMLAFFIPSIVY